MNELEGDGSEESMYPKTLLKQEAPIRTQAPSFSVLVLLMLQGLLLAFFFPPPAQLTSWPHLTPLLTDLMIPLRANIPQVTSFSEEEPFSKSFLKRDYLFKNYSRSKSLSLVTVDSLFFAKMSQLKDPTK